MAGIKDCEHDILYQQRCEQIEINFPQAANRGIVDPVVIVMDLRAPLATRLAPTAW